MYFYENSKLFHCYTGCTKPTFDIFELYQRICSIQQHRTIDLNAAIREIAEICGIYIGLAEEREQSPILEDWRYLQECERIKEVKRPTTSNLISLKVYDNQILKNLSYNIKLVPWLQEGINLTALRYANIGYYLSDDQITIPHYDIDNNFIGLRGRAMCAEDAARWGKYRPLRINGILYTHPLGFNLYNLNKSKNNIKHFKKVVLFESEKSCLKYQSYFGTNRDISVACCGSHVSNYQIQLLLSLDVQEIIIALDRQFQEIGDNEFLQLKNNLLRIRDKYKNEALISFIFDKRKITEYKDSPIDRGPTTFLELYSQRIIL